MNQEKKEEVRKPASSQGWLMIVIVAALLLGVSIVESLRYFRPVHALKSGSSVLRETLPDGSAVVLNQHSRLTLSDEWKGGDNREAWLEGEGFFTTVGTGDTNGVTIHTPRFDVVAFDARFSLFNRSNKMIAWLQEGNAYILSHDSKPRRLLFAPGEMVQFMNRKFVTTTPPDSSHIRWKDMP